MCFDLVSKMLAVSFVSDFSNKKPELFKVLCKKCHLFFSFLFKKQTKLAQLWYQINGKFLQMQKTTILSKGKPPMRLVKTATKSCTDAAFNIAQKLIPLNINVSRMIKHTNG